MSSAVAATAALASLPESGPDSEWRDAAKAFLAAQRERVRADFSAAADTQRLLLGWCAAIDAVVVSAWQRSFAAAKIDAAGLTLLATGGYGRRELYPHSDIDLLVLAEARVQKRAEPALSRLWALLWDAGLAAGHAVRSTAQCVDAARGDIATLTSMLELRTLAGDDAARASLSAALAPSKLWPPAKYFQAKREEQQARHARFNDTADNLEPNLKEGPGGLRDLHTVTWMGMRLYGVPGLRALVPLGLLGADECASLEQRWAEIARLRFGLHLVANSREERLLFDPQKAPAALMGLQDGEGNLAVREM